MESIKGTFELVGGTSKGLSTGNLIVIGTAILSFISVLVSVFLTNRMTKKINKNNNSFQESFNKANNKFQEKLNQKNIDANLKAKARIEWIQNVRNTSAELISLYYKLLNSTDKNNLFEILIACQEKAELLILYFGPEVQKQNQETIPYIYLESLESNQGKNDLFVKFLLKLNSDFYLYYDKVLKDEKSDLEQTRKEQLKMMRSNPVGYIDHGYLYDDLCDDYGGRINCEEPIYDEDLKDMVNETEKKLQEYKSSVNDLNKGLIQLRNIIRIYLKIEWNKAKNGE